MLRRVRERGIKTRSQGFMPWLVSRSCGQAIKACLRAGVSVGVHQLAGAKLVLPLEPQKQASALQNTFSVDISYLPNREKNFFMLRRFQALYFKNLKFLLKILRFKKNLLNYQGGILVIASGIL
ncbi:MAG: hypothetical protein KAX39_06585 [candidate division Zixibacteria bacterium]|nr:hypothetical protein [candidate division Zixibacteria bacterium]